MDRMRSIAFALLTPFFFLRAGLLISIPALLSGAGVIAILFVAKMSTKLVGVWPVAAAFGIRRRDRNYVTLLMATGLTFGSTSALFGLTHGLVSEAQYSPASDGRHPVGRDPDGDRTEAAPAQADRRRGGGCPGS